MSTATQILPSTDLSPTFAAQAALTASAEPAAGIEADVLVLGACCQNGKAEILSEGAALDGLGVSDLEELLEVLSFTGSQDAIVRIPGVAVPGVAASTVVVVGVGKGLEWAEDATRDCAALGEGLTGVLARAAGAAVRATSTAEHVVLALPAGSVQACAAVARGALAAAYSWSGRVPNGAGVPARLTLATSLGQEKVSSIVARATALAQALRLARDLVNEPPNRLTPQVFVSLALREAQTLAADLPAGRVETEVLDAAALKEGGFGGITGVGQGSVHPPYLVRVSWIPVSDQAVKRVGLIGKGITFDSGGLSLKPPASMPEMKSDMAGAATVLATVLAAAREQLAVRVDAWLALAENMPTTDAQRPSDIVTMYGGTTVEITNTDAEGRLVMADALARAVEDDLDAVVDVATLTGAQIVALGDRVSGVMGTPALRDAVAAAAQRVDEAFWPMPLPEHLASVLESPYAALRNSAMGTRAGGMLVAGLFLREFVGDTPWAHLDVAGPAFNDGKPWGGTPQGGTGVGIATLIELLSSMSAAH